MYCNKCGNKLEDTWDCCPKCGFLVNSNKIKCNVDKVKEESEKKAIVYMVIFIVSIISIILVFLITEKISVLLLAICTISVVTGCMKCPQSKTMNICMIIYICCAIIGISIITALATCYFSTGYCINYSADNFCSYCGSGETDYNLENFLSNIFGI